MSRPGDETARDLRLVEIAYRGSVAVAIVAVFYAAVWWVGRRFDLSSDGPWGIFAWWSLRMVAVASLVWCVLQLRRFEKRMKQFQAQRSG